MPVKRFMTEIPITFDNNDDLIIHRTIQYETYAASPEDAETTARMFVQDFSKKLAQNTQNHVSNNLYDWKSAPSIDEPIKVWETHKHHDHLDSEEDLPLVYKGD